MAEYVAFVTVKKCLPLWPLAKKGGVCDMCGVCSMMLNVTLT